MLHSNNKLKIPAYREILQYTYKSLLLCLSLRGKLRFGVILRFCHLCSLSTVETGAPVMGCVSFLRRLPLFLLVLWPTNCCSPVVWVGTWVSPQQNWQCPREAVSLIQWSPSKQSLKQCKPQDPGLRWQVPENHKLWVFNSAPVPETTTSTRSTQCQSR